MGSALFAAFAIGVAGKQSRHFAVLAVTTQQGIGLDGVGITTTAFLAVSPSSIRHFGVDLLDESPTSRRVTLAEEKHYLRVVADELTSRSAASVHAAMVAKRRRLCDDECEVDGADEAAGGERAVTRAAAVAAAAAKAAADGVGVGGDGDGDGVGGDGDGDGDGVGGGDGDGDGDGDWGDGGDGDDGDGDGDSDDDGDGNCDGDGYRPPAGNPAKTSKLTKAAIRKLTKGKGQKRLECLDTPQLNRYAAELGAG